MTNVNAFIRQFLSQYKPYKSYWNYEDGCVLKGCIDLYAATGDDEYRRFVANDFVERVYVGNRLGLISNLMESDDLTAEDIAELKKIIEEK